MSRVARRSTCSSSTASATWSLRAARRSGRATCAPAAEGRLLAGRRSESFTAVELADEQKPPVLRAYLKRWKFEVGVFFDGVGPDSSEEELLDAASKHPVFRILEALMSARARANRSDRHRLRRAGDRGRLRRARQRGLVRGHRRGQGRAPAARRGRRSTSRGSRSCWRATPARLHFSTDLAGALEHARLLFVAVGTPPTYSGDADLSAVHAVVDAIPASQSRDARAGDEVDGAVRNRRLAAARLRRAGQGGARVRLLPRVPQGGLGGRRTSCTPTASSSGTTATGRATRWSSSTRR